MNKSYALIAVATFAAIASTGVRAETPDPASQFALQSEGSRTRAEVVAEAVTTVKTYSNIPSGSRVAAPVKSAVPTAIVRGEAAQALRLGKIKSGELTGLEG
ncbi:DUF4148 domain-containing protein [Polaromonas sp.]|uniref:DUF4148 domain-containing protein n=1 Tax=Polaromonas sp. TaxID=1869339 RepID=UPI0024893AC8|nr:DUF4148 domain-containing protein [Polaromonas sp.]MDI1273207.1 DUF4148 domain-containing protein [Polaromonas sp.]